MRASRACCARAHEKTLLRQRRRFPARRPHLKKTYEVVQYAIQAASVARPRFFPTFFQARFFMDEVLLLDAGSGGRASQRLIAEIFLRAFDNEYLASLDDAAILPGSGRPLAMSTDGYTVSPLFFPGGSIGSLAVHGTVNDVSCMGARPLWLSCAFILEEGLSVAELARVADDMASACRESGVRIVTGDTKVVPKGACDRIFITTTGVGEVVAENPPRGSRARPGDAVLVSGNMGEHGLAIMSARENLSFLTGVRSDSAPLGRMVERLLAACPDVHVLRDPTRGGLATTLNEIAQSSGVDILLEEESIPVSEDVRGGCSFLGLDPLYLANEGKLICIVPADCAESALAAMRESPYGKMAAVIGRVVESDSAPLVSLRTPIGGRRVLSMLEGAQLPRIC